MARRWFLLAGVVFLIFASCGDGDDGDAVAGGQMYDKWWTVTGDDAPETDNPVWSRQTTNERSGSDTWRCKECHGWDYKGAEGAYGSGSHFTGFPGIFAAQDKSADELTDQIMGNTDADHDFSSFFSDEDVANVVAFIKGGLDDYGQFIADDKSVIGGDTAAGESFYSSICATCHGADGTQLNFGDEEEPEFVGTIAVDNPWEFFHKVKYGQPGTQMPTASDNDLSIEDIRDILAYAQTLAVG